VSFYKKHFRLALDNFLFSLINIQPLFGCFVSFTKIILELFRESTFQNDTSILRIQLMSKNSLIIPLTEFMVKFKTQQQTRPQELGELAKILQIILQELVVKLNC